MPSDKEESKEIRENSKNTCIDNSLNPYTLQILHIPSMLGIITYCQCADYKDNSPH